MRSKPCSCRLAVQSRTAAIIVEGRSEIVPGKPRWCWAMPTAKVGPTSTSPSPWAARAIASGQMASVPRRPVGPCCSVEPTGTTIVREPRASRASISGQVERVSSTAAPIWR